MTTTTIQIQAQSLRPEHIVRDPFGVERTVHHAETFLDDFQVKLTRVAWMANGVSPSIGQIFTATSLVTIVVEAATNDQFEGL